MNSFHINIPRDSMKIKTPTIFVGANESIFAKDLIKLPSFWNAKE